MKRRSLGGTQIATLFIFVLALGYLGWLGYGALPEPEPTPTPVPVLTFAGESALDYAQAQCDFGPRPSGSPAGIRTGNWIIEQLQAQGWEVDTHEFTWNGTPVRNIIAKTGEGPILMLGAHYDTRLIADRDPNPELRALPVLGGNDAASGAAVLLELARVIDKQALQTAVWLTFFDAEDNGDIEGWDWGVGSNRLAEELDPLPSALILVDMVGDSEQRLPFEGTSDVALRQQVWDLAAELGYEDVFVPELGSNIIDDHTGFLRQGVPAIDIIDFDYPYWHTTEDTCDKLSADSLQRVGRVLEIYAETNQLLAFLASGE